MPLQRTAAVTGRRIHHHRRLSLAYRSHPLVEQRLKCGDALPPGSGRLPPGWRVAGGGFVVEAGLRLAGRRHSDTFRCFFTVLDGFGHRVTTRVALRYQLILVPENLDDDSFGLPGRSLVDRRTRVIHASCPAEQIYENRRACPILFRDRLAVIFGEHQHVCCLAAALHRFRGTAFIVTCPCRLDLDQRFSGGLVSRSDDPKKDALVKIYWSPSVPPESAGSLLRPYRHQGTPVTGCLLHGPSSLFHELDQKLLAVAFGAPNAGSGTDRGRPLPVLPWRSRWCRRTARP